MKVKVIYYKAWDEVDGRGSITFDDLNPRWNVPREAEVRAEHELGFKPEYMRVEVDYDPLHYACEHCGQGPYLRCQKNGTILGYFHDARKIAAGILEPPPRYFGWYRSGRKRKYHEREEHRRTPKFEANRKNRRDRRQARVEIRKEAV